MSPVDHYVDQQDIDTTTPQGKLLFQITSLQLDAEFLLHGDSCSGPDR